MPTIAFTDGTSTRSRASRALRLRSPRDTPLPLPMNVLLLRWDTKPDKRIRGTFLRPASTRRTSFYAADRAGANERELLRVNLPLSLVASIEEPVEVGVRGKIAIAHQGEDLGPVPRLLHQRVGLRQPGVVTADGRGV